MRKISALLKWIILLPILLVVLLLAIANDQSVTLHLNPFDTADPVLKVDLALYQLAFAFFFLGALAGGLAVWSGQHKYRRRARERREEAAVWQERARRSERPRDETPAAQSRIAAFLPRPQRG